MNKSILGEISEEHNLSIPQICPLQLQLGDTLFISSEPSFQTYGMNLVNVSKEEFINCPRAGFLQEQLIFVCQIKGLHQVDPNWLGAGTHYFAELHKRGPLLCNMGLRLNVTVKQQLCQQSPGAPLCSGHGKCLSHVWEKTYNCHCFSQYSGTFCQKFDICSAKPCHNNASCMEKSELSEDSYECTCPPKFSGKNCTEIVGQCQPSTCFNGNCIDVTPNTFLCECDKGFTGPFCEEPGDPCASQPCLNGGICQYNQSGYVCNCPSGFLGHNCEININECSSRPCQNRGTCIDLPNDVACICMPIFTGKFCERILNPCELLPCLNNATCVAQQHNYHCRCMPGFTGRNCEEVIDYCRLLSVNCLNEGLCLNIIGGFTDVRITSQLPLILRPVIFPQSSLVKGQRKIFPEPFLLQTEQPKLSQPVLGKLLQPSVAALVTHSYYINGFVVMRIPDLDAALQPVLVPGVSPTNVQDLTFGLVEPCYEFSWTHISSLFSTLDDVPYFRMDLKHLKKEDTG
uniref:protein eyes shut homolog n=1 Tax=Lonchura striata TaxID=40157 RepID=UPI000B4DDFF9|nr:protein eyes shut homolog [Lonchura striata domestica]